MDFSRVEKTFMRKIIDTSKISEDEVYIVSRIFDKVLGDGSSTCGSGGCPTKKPDNNPSEIIVKGQTGLSLIVDVPDDEVLNIERCMYEVNGCIQALKQPMIHTDIRQTLIKEYMMSFMQYNMTFDRLVSEIMVNHNLDPHNVVLTHKELIFSTSEMVILYDDISEIIR